MVQFHLRLHYTEAVSAVFLCEEVEGDLQLQRMVTQATAEGAATKEPLLGSAKKSDGVGERRCSICARQLHLCAAAATSTPPSGLCSAYLSCQLEEQPDGIHGYVLILVI